MKELQKVPESLAELQASYDRLYEGWMGEHMNTGQAELMLDLLEVRSGARLLDVACGLGYVAEMAAQRGLDAVGIDVSRVALRKAQSLSSKARMFTLGDAERLPWRDDSFDFAVNLGSLEHFIDPAGAVREMARILKPQGRAALLLPNSHHIRALYYVYRYGKIFPDLQDYERFATRAEWENLLTSNGLRVVATDRYDTGMARIHKEGNELFWYLFNAFFKLFGNRWIPFNFAYTFIFICEPQSVYSTSEGVNDSA